MANYELNVPNSPDMVFRIGSITKSFTGLAVLQLEEKGLLKVSDPVSKYVPEMPEGWNAITIHDLLCHKSGIPDFTSTHGIQGLQRQPARGKRAEGVCEQAAGEQAWRGAALQQLRLHSAGQSD